MKKLAFAVVFLFGAVLVFPAMSAIAGENGYCDYGANKAVQAKKDVKEVEAEYAGLVQEARKDGKISDSEQATLDFYRLQNNISLAKAKAIEDSGS
jgi:hypothetical protein